MKSKNLLLVFLAIVLFTFQSCKKDSNSTIQINLKGRWDATSAISEVFQNNVSKQKQSLTIDKGSLYFIFTDSKVEIYVDSKLSDDGTYTYDQSSQQLTIKYDVNDIETIQLSNVTATSFTAKNEESVVNGSVTTKTVSQIDFKKQ